MKRIIIISFAVMFLLSACSIFQTITNISRLKFKLDSIDNFQINGMPISDKTRISDFKTMDIIKLSSILFQKKFPVSFEVNIAANNPNDGTGGYPATDIVLKSFPWDLYINGEKTISGNISEPVTVPGIGEQKTIKLYAEMDLLQFFGNRKLNEILNLALQLGGGNRSTSNVQVIANPVLGTSIGDISYPEPLKIVDHTFK